LANTHPARRSQRADWANFNSLTQQKVAGERLGCVAEEFITFRNPLILMEPVARFELAT
jgi:hypothetical protein